MQIPRALCDFAARRNAVLSEFPEALPIEQHYSACRLYIGFASSSPLIEIDLRASPAARSAAGEQNYHLRACVFDSSFLFHAPPRPLAHAIAQLC